MRKEIQVLFLSLLLATVCLALFAAPAQAQSYDDQEIEFLYLLNDYRASQGLYPLQINAKLSNASEAYSALMGQTNCFSHECGSTIKQRIVAAGYTYYTSYGENIAANTIGSEAAIAFDQWYHSEGHRLNMVSTLWCAVGVGRVYVPGSTYGWYWTTDFGGVCEGDPQPPRRDETPPIVNFAAPADWSNLNGTVYFQANANDNRVMDRVDFYINSNLVATDTDPPYSFVQDMSGYFGSVTAYAVAYDGAGNSAADQVEFQIQAFQSTNKYLFTWYDQSGPSWKDWVISATTGATDVTNYRIKLANDSIAGGLLQTGNNRTANMFDGVMGGPVEVAADRSIISSQRVLYKNSFNEIAGTDVRDLESTYYFSWYDSTPGNGMLGAWILVGNQGNQTADVDIYIAGSLKGTYHIGPGERVTPSYPNISDGPVEVTSTNGQPLIVSQRVFYHDSFNEVLGIPASRLTDDYLFTYYDNKNANNMNGNWIVIANQESTNAQVDLYIGDTKMESFDISPFGRITPTYFEEEGGPVRVVSTNGKKLIVSQRILYKNSFEEFQALTAQNLSDELWFSWYDSLPQNGMIGDWVMVANPGGQTAEVDIYVDSLKRGSYSIDPGAEVTPSYVNLSGGPVRIVSTNGVPVLATQRVLYLDSFNEIAGMRLRP